MKIGIIANYLKANIFDLIKELVEKFNEADIEVIFSESVKEIIDVPENYWKNFNLYSDHDLAENSDIVISIGGDGTLLQTAYNTRKSNTPLIGVNFGKLGFLAEYDTSKIDELVNHLKQENFEIEKRNALDAVCTSEETDSFYAINDIVIDRGKYPKMIEISIQIDDEEVSTFSADGIIIATPTGSTGYSLSTGGPIVNPKTKAITLSPISAHTLTMRPIVISSEQKIVLRAKSQYSTVQIICDGQRVNYLKTPAEIVITKSDHDLLLVHNQNKKYFEILRQKLYWGLDLRINNGDKN